MDFLNLLTLLVKPEIREVFRRSLRELATLKINPVTIPEKYGIVHIPNLLDTYYRKVAEERDAKLEIETRLKLVEGSFSKQTIEILRKQELG